MSERRDPEIAPEVGQDQLGVVEADLAQGRIGDVLARDRTGFGPQMNAACRDRRRGGRNHHSEHPGVLAPGRQGKGHAGLIGCPG